MVFFEFKIFGIFALLDVILVFSLAPGLLAYLSYDFRTFFFSVSTHPVTDESVVGISVSAAREFAAFVPDLKLGWLSKIETLTGLLAQFLNPISHLTS